ncbi:hypothetical protein EJ03DRAFT_173003 [Teratosphaeria nubilosa]|uniref:Uncharacterized protein n=1 Tax=Teratosphaeria nubilosa TaxID=161662 RepID=A0A6G1LJ58_9PEZI|nr:hypothetical protein EJ03DRAFT_173003 [Teratosphaeria nubilosa]
MLPASQPHRPKLQGHQQPSPLYQQQTRTLHSASSPQLSRPTSQIEAMPPFTTPIERTNHPLPMYNPALVHPVFFTDAWRKPPFPMPLSAGISPVAAGYVFGSAKSNMTKL